MAKFVHKNQVLEKNLRDFKGRFIKRLEQEYKLSYVEVVDLLSNAESNLQKKDVLIPISIFDNKELSAFETLCKYFKEELDFSYHKIAILLRRDDRTIWATYKKAVGKRNERVKVRKSEIKIPHSIFKDRKFSVLESLVKFLKEKIELRFSEIGVLLHKDQRNIWTVYNRAKKKE